MAKRTTISDAQLETEIIKQFQKGNSAKTEMCGNLRKKFRLGTDRFIKTYDIAYSKWQKQKEKAEAEQMYENGKEGLKSGLKSKIEREAELEKLLDPDYWVEESRIDMSSGKVLKYNRKLQPKEIQLIHAELSKMRGDYSPNKVEHSGEITAKNEVVKLPEGQTTNDLKDEIQELVNGQD